MDHVEVSRHHNGKYRVNIWQQPEPDKNIAVTIGPRIGLSYYLTVSDTGEIIHSNPPHDQIVLFGLNLPSLVILGLTVHPVARSCRLHGMTKTDFMLHRERLLALRARLRGDMTQMEDNALNKDHNKTTSMPNDMAELGSGNFDQELTLSLLGSEKDALDQIEAAIERIEDGSYGQCEECGRKIPKSRLEAIPYAALCVRCARKGRKATILDRNRHKGESARNRR